MTAVMYSTNYFRYEPDRQQASAVRVLTDGSHPIGADDPRIALVWARPDNGGMDHGRACAAWWKYHPDQVAPEADVTIWINGNFEIRADDLVERCLAELGSDDVLLMRHPWRDDIADEEAASHPNIRFDSQDTAGQVRTYLDDGHPAHWGLFHAGFIVRRNTPAVQTFNDAAWDEWRRWSSQDQLILPYLIRKSGLRWHAWPDVGEWHAQPFEEGWLHYGGIGR